MFLRHPHGASFPKESCQVLPRPQHTVLLSPTRSSELAPMTRAEGQLGATSSQGPEALGSLRELQAALEPLTVHKPLGTEVVWLAVVCEKV